MNDTLVPPPNEAPSNTEPMSLGARLFNVFAAPGELFEELRDARVAHSNWLIPMLLSMMLGIVVSYVITSQPDIVANVAAQQDSALAARVKAGKLTQDQADKASEMMAKYRTPKMMMTFGAMFAVIGTGLGLTVMSLVLWLLTAKILKGEIPLNKSFEMCGLASMIGLVGGILTMLTILWKGNIAAAPNAALLVGDFDQTRYLHQFLAAINFVTLWYMVVLSIGAAKLSRRSVGAAAVWIFGFWFVIRFGLAAGTAWWAQFQAKM